MGESKKTKRTAGDIIRGVILVVAVGVLIYAGWNLWTIRSEYAKSENEYKALEEYAPVSNEESAELETELPEEPGAEGIKGMTIVKCPVDFESLEAINPDVAGWLKVGAIDISYPIAYGTDNEFYLHHTLEKTYNFAGCIFIDYQNHKDLTDNNTVLYGHNMKNGSMFGKLRKFAEQETYDADPYIWIYTKDFVYKYEIFSTHVVDAVGATYQLVFETDEKFEDYLATMMSQSLIKATEDLYVNDKIITLSTCTGDDSTRFVVQAKKVETYRCKDGKYAVK